MSSDQLPPRERRAVPAATYLLPIKLSAPPTDELTDYLERIASWCELIVVDGSSPPLFDDAQERWSPFALHVPPDPRHRCLNGKVHGVLTGLDLVVTDVVIVADDDVRYDLDALVACVDALDAADLVRPQNYFDPLPWHARWDTARTLLNRSTGSDWPGTLVMRTDSIRRAGGYDGDVLFENLEMVRTVERAGGRSVTRPDLYVRRLPPSAAHFWSQRVRQAYDEFARPMRLAISLAILPLVGTLVMGRRWGSLTALAAGAVATAEVGRRRCGGVRRFPTSSALLAPAWLLERGICSWLALGRRLTGGVPYSSGKIVHAATPRRHLGGGLINDGASPAG
ncbi:MAG: glycosyltransferase family 2 protein [Ilumatobacteraceae bacterium]